MLASERASRSEELGTYLQHSRSTRQLDVTGVMQRIAMKLKQDRRGSQFAGRVLQSKKYELQRGSQHCRTWSRPDDMTLEDLRKVAEKGQTSRGAATNRTTPGRACQKANVNLRESLQSQRAKTHMPCGPTHASILLIQGQ